MILFYLLLELATILLLLSYSNHMKRAKKGEKTTTGIVQEFNLRFKNKDSIFINNYEAIIKANNKKYVIEGYSMPWLKEDEEVKIQITGKQKVLGTTRLSKKSRIEFILGICTIILAFLYLCI